MAKRPSSSYGIPSSSMKRQRSASQVSLQGFEADRSSPIRSSSELQTQSQWSNLPPAEFTASQQSLLDWADNLSQEHDSGLERRRDVGASKQSDSESDAGDRTLAVENTVTGEKATPIDLTAKKLLIQHSTPAERLQLALDDTQQQLTVTQTELRIACKSSVDLREVTEALSVRNRELWRMVQSLTEEKDGQCDELAKVSEQLDEERCSRNQIIWSMAEDLRRQRDAQRQEIQCLKRQLAGWKKLGQDIGQRVQEADASGFQ